MIDKNVHSRLHNVFGKIFYGVPDEKLESLTTLNAERWDSLAHLNLIISLEEEFEIRINSDEAGNITSFISALSILESKL